MSPSIWQLLIVLAIVLVLFGAKRLRNIGGDLGGAVKGFKQAMNDDSETDSKSATEESERLNGETRDSADSDAGFDHEGAQAKQSDDTDARR